MRRFIETILKSSFAEVATVKNPEDTLNWILNINAIKLIIERGSRI